MSVLERIHELRTAARPRPWPLERPRHLQLPVNDICNSRCSMCHIWQRKRDDEISPEALREALASPLFRDVVGVGVNGGEPTLRRDLAELVAALFDALPRLRGISLITNALVSKTVIPRIEEVGEVVARRGGHLDVMVSLDGVGEVHDRVRGRVGNFENAERVLDFLETSPRVDGIRLGCTVVHDNVYGIEDLLEYAIARDVYVKYRLGIPHRRLYTHDIHEPFALDHEARMHLCVFLGNLIRHYERSPRQRFFYESLIGQLAHGEPRRAGCDWQHRAATLTSRGELAYCAVESRSLGSLIGGDAEALWREGDSHRKEIVRSKCDDCTHDYEGLPPAPELLRETLAKLAERSGASRLPFELRTLRAGVRRHRFQARRRKLGLSGSPGGAVRLEGAERPRRVLLCGWYGTETLGDKAILGGVVATLRRALPDAELTLATFDPAISALTAAQMPELDGVAIAPLRDAHETLFGAQLLVMAGGPLMGLDTLADIESLFARAAAFGVPSIVAGCGVGPLGHPGHDASIRHILELASERIYRDFESRETAGRLGVEVTADLVAEDPAFAWLESQRPRPDGKSNEAPRLFLGLRDWPQAEYRPDRSRSARSAAAERFEGALVEALERLVGERPELTLVPFPMCTNHHGGDDRWFHRRLFRGRPALQAAIDRAPLGRELSPQHALAMLRACDAAIAMRFHSLVFALANQVPAFAIDYSGSRGKVGSLARRYGIAHESPDTLDAARIHAHVATLLDDAPVPPRLEAPRFPRVFGETLARLPLARPKHR